MLFRSEGWDVGRHCSGLWRVILVPEVNMNSRFQLYKLKKRQDRCSSSLWQDVVKLRWYVIKFKLHCHGRGILGCDMHHQYEKGITYCIWDNVQEKLTVKWYERRKVRQEGEVAR